MGQHDDIVSTSKFKPSKPSLAALQKQQQRQESVVDDWEAESSDEDAPKAQDPFQQTKQEWTRAYVVLAECRTDPVLTLA